MITGKTAVLMNVVSIQQYIFGSNKLKENIGASYIIEEGLQLRLKNSLERITGSGVDMFAWKDSTSVLPDNYPIGFAGGGNTLLFFENNNIAKSFIEDFTTDTLLNFPGLRLSFGLKEDFNLTNYQADYNDLLQDLKKRKYSYIPIVHIPKHGITSDCPLSNDAAEFLDKDLGAFISSSSSVKIASAGISKWDDFLVRKGLDKEYEFRNDIEDTLGQKEKGSYIAVVHVDGNGMGNVFSNINSLEDLRSKSSAVSNKAVRAMESVIEILIDDHRNGRLAELNLEKTKPITLPITLPIRPVLVGVDDVTFICEGRLGIYLAECFIREFYDEEQRKNKDESKKLMDGACAGIAIIKTHFPFFKAVELAEELCKEAKITSKAAPGTGSFISYYYSSTTFSGSLNQLREKTQKSALGLMHYGPYRLFDKDDPKSIEKLKEGIICFKNANGGVTWPKNKVMLLREIIARDNGSQKVFEKELSEAGLKLPGNTGGTIWFTKDQKNETPYFDQIELMDYYPDQLLKKNLL